jgi:serine/threonine-protein phosphatase 6 regulatory subunit 3
LQDVFFDDESAEVVISSLRLGEAQASNVSWFTSQDDRTKEESSPTFLISSSLSQNED